MAKVEEVVVGRACRPRTAVAAATTTTTGVVVVVGRVARRRAAARRWLLREMNFIDEQTHGQHARTHAHRRRR